MLTSTCWPVTKGATMPRRTISLPEITNAGLPNACWTTSWMLPGAGLAGGCGCMGGCGGGCCEGGATLGAPSACAWAAQQSDSAAARAAGEREVRITAMLAAAPGAQPVCALAHIEEGLGPRSARLQAGARVSGARQHQHERRDQRERREHQQRDLPAPFLEAAEGE